jgi:predicted ABC-type ATPase
VAKSRGLILVAAGTNGAGKSAIIGESLALNGAAYFNPDLHARRLATDLGLPLEEANARSWETGYRALQLAIDRNEDFSFETTLGGRSVVRELHRAARAGLKVHLFYVGLSSVELHIARVKARVVRGGHPIPRDKIRERYPASLINLIGLLGVVSEVHVFDNSEESPDGLPMAKRVFRMRGKRIYEPAIAQLLNTAPEWSKPVVAAAISIHE